jgi:zinc protease
MRSILSCAPASVSRVRLALFRRVLRHAAVAAVGLAATIAATVAPATALPKVQKVVSPGGVEAWLMQLNDAPLITMRLAFKGGVLQDPDGKYGTTIMAAYMFDEGAGSYDSADLKRRLTRIGVGLGAGSNTQYTTISFSTPSMYKDEALELLQLAFSAPRYDAEPIARARTYYLNAVEAAQRNPASVGGLALRTRIFGKHPLAVDWARQKSGYESITADSIKLHRASALARDNLKVTVVGDIDAATLAPLLDKMFASLPAKASARPVPAPARGAGSCQFTAMDVPQAVVQFSGVTPPLTWRQRLAWWALDVILNEGISAGRLTRELREKRGLVYGVSTSYDHYTAFEQPFGLFEGSFAAKMSEVPEALTLLRRELRRMIDEGPTEDEVGAVKPALVGKTLLGLDTGAAIANLLINLQAADQPPSFLDDIDGEIQSITRQDVWDVAKLLLDPDRLHVSIVGQPAQPNACEVLAAQK